MAATPNRPFQRRHPVRRGAGGPAAFFRALPAAHLPLARIRTARLPVKTHPGIRPHWCCRICPGEKGHPPGGKPQAYRVGAYGRWGCVPGGGAMASQQAAPRRGDVDYGGRSRNWPANRRDFSRHFAVWLYDLVLARFGIKPAGGDGVFISRWHPDDAVRRRTKNLQGAASPRSRRSARALGLGAFGSRRRLSRLVRRREMVSPLRAIPHLRRLRLVSDRARRPDPGFYPIAALPPDHSLRRRLFDRRGRVRLSLGEQLLERADRMEREH